MVMVIHPSFFDRKGGREAVISALLPLTKRECCHGHPNTSSRRRVGRWPCPLSSSSRAVEELYGCGHPISLPKGRGEGSYNLGPFLWGGVGVPGKLRGLPYSLDGNGKGVRPMAFLF